MKNTLIAIIIIVLVATVAFLGGKLSNTTNGSHTDEPQSAVTDTVKVDTMSFEQKLAMADSVLNLKKNVKYRSEKDFEENEVIVGIYSKFDEEGSLHAYDTFYLTRITTYENGLPELAIEWSNGDDNNVYANAISFFTDEGKKAAVKTIWLMKWMCYESASKETKKSKKRTFTTGFDFIVDDPRSCLSIKN